MYTPQESSKLKQSFWTTFGQYMAPLPSAEGLKVNWVNYKTGISNISFKMDADNNTATISILLSHSDEGIQQLYFEQFLQLKRILDDTLQEEWTWEAPTANEYGKPISRIYKPLTGVNIYKKEDWPALISFFKQRLLLLDEFWSSAKYAFESLA
ncbi:MAG: DUF4268 domain-containing protein [Bacteroidetes bacterium]|nr:DUF4268 domain-containing protein [Bacteroidota bacterium]